MSSAATIRGDGVESPDPILQEKGHLSHRYVQQRLRLFAGCLPTWLLVLSCSHRIQHKHAAVSLLALIQSEIPSLFPDVLQTMLPFTFPAMSTRSISSVSELSHRKTLRAVSCTDIRKS